MFQGLISITKDALRSTENLKKVFEHGVSHKSDPIEQHVRDINRPQEVFRSGLHGQTHLASFLQPPPDDESPPSSLGES